MKTHLNPRPMITLDHLGGSSILNFHISYIEDNACFKFGGIGGCPFVLKIFHLQLSCFLCFPLVSCVF